uniref:Putative secreted protein n=1 Tax=Anopheles darlingi TaxID=43151 RepID=A0A2M4DM75_ANODA
MPVVAVVVVVVVGVIAFGSGFCSRAADAATALHAPARRWEGVGGGFGEPFPMTSTRPPLATSRRLTDLHFSFSSSQHTHTHTHTRHTLLQRRSRRWRRTGKRRGHHHIHVHRPFLAVRRGEVCFGVLVWAG